MSGASLRLRALSVLTGAGGSGAAGLVPVCGLAGLWLEVRDTSLSLLVRGGPSLCASSSIVKVEWPSYSEDEACAPLVGPVSVRKCPPDRTRGGCVSFPTIKA